MNGWGGNLPGICCRRKIDASAVEAFGNPEKKQDRTSRIAAKWTISGLPSVS
jgi:hypothetical protein